MNTFVNSIKHTIIGITTLSCLMMSTSHAAQVTISPLSLTVNLDELVTISLDVSGLEEQNISVFDLDVLYDNTILEFVSYGLTDNLGINDIDALDLSMPATSGLVNIAQTSLLDGDEFANSISMSAVNGSVSSVPEPSTGALMIAGILGLFTFCKKNRKRFC